MNRFKPDWDVMQTMVEHAQEMGARIEELEAEVQNWMNKCETYIDIHDAVVRDNDRLYDLLSRCEVEMRYAGWMPPIADNAGRNDVYEDVVACLRGDR